MTVWWGRSMVNSVNEAVLAELRAIRAEIHELTQRVGNAATRDDLDDYLPRDVFNAHVAEQQRRTQDWRFWLPYALSALALLVAFMSAQGVHLVGGR
jgi:hypothetical protein